MRPQHHLLFAATAAQRALDRGQQHPGAGQGQRQGFAQTQTSIAASINISARLERLTPGVSRQRPSADLRLLLRKAPGSGELYGRGACQLHVQTDPTSLTCPGRRSGRSICTPLHQGTNDVLMSFVTFSDWQELLRTAQARVSWESWVVCVRTYARSAASGRVGKISCLFCFLGGQARWPHGAHDESVAICRAA